MLKVPYRVIRKIPKGKRKWRGSRKKWNGKEKTITLKMRELLPRLLRLCVQSLVLFPARNYNRSFTSTIIGVSWALSFMCRSLQTQSWRLHTIEEVDGWGVIHVLCSQHITMRYPLSLSRSHHFCSQYSPIHKKAPSCAWQFSWRCWTWTPRCWTCRPWSTSSSGKSLRRRRSRVATRWPRLWCLTCLLWRSTTISSPNRGGWADFCRTTSLLTGRCPTAIAFLLRLTTWQISPCAVPAPLYHPRMWIGKTTY